VPAWSDVWTVTCREVLRSPLPCRYGQHGCLVRPPTLRSSLNFVLNVAAGRFVLQPPGTHRQWWPADPGGPHDVDAPTRTAPRGQRMHAHATRGLRRRLTDWIDCRRNGHAWETTELALGEVSLLRTDCARCHRVGPLRGIRHPSGPAPADPA